MEKIHKITAVSTYPPRQCGIATFTQHLFAPFISDGRGKKSSVDVNIVAISPDHKPTLNYPDEVVFEIRSSHLSDYRRAAEFINLSNTDVISLQHEFGIFGGEAGEYILQFLNELRKPVVTTLHTVLSNPEDIYFNVLTEICRLSSLIIVQCKKAEEFLADIYKVPKEKIRVVYHGAPDVPFLDPYLYKERFNADNKMVLLTFGLLSPNKGIEVALDALPEVVRKFPNVLYIILGRTHPEIVKTQGEKYRLSLQQKVNELGLEENVVFHNYFVTQEELIQYLTAADIFITPYLSKEQIVSGTLTYAIACGKAIISTPYYYAEEMLSDGKGYLVPFNNPAAIRDALMELLDNTQKLNELRKECYQFGRQLVQSKISEKYLEVFSEGISLYKQAGKVISISVGSKIYTADLPDVNLDHLYLLTDDTGIFQHTTYTIPSYQYGYTTDDNARALITAYQNWRYFKNTEIMLLINRYLSFLNYAFDREKRRFHNFVGYDRRFMDEIGSEDSHARALWALGYIIKEPPNPSILMFGSELFKLAANSLHRFTSPRAWAYGLIACCKYLERFGGDVEIKELVLLLAERLNNLYEKTATPEWKWFEEVVAYDNARIPQALIMAARRLQDRNLLKRGVESLQWLLDIQTNHKKNCISLVGNNGWLVKGGKKADFDQQAVEIPALIDACAEVYISTKEEKWLTKMLVCFQWFLGRNDLNVVLYDSNTGGCYDGLTSKGVNQNQGAESTLSFLMSLHTIYQYRHLVLQKVKK